MLTQRLDVQLLFPFLINKHKCNRYGKLGIILDALRKNRGSFIEYLIISHLYIQMNRFQSVCVLMLLSTCLYSQSVLDGELTRRMDQGVSMMEAGDYEAAQKEFLFVMNNMESLPSEMAYYFGRNSFHVNKYKQSINWLNKYIQLKGTQGRYYTMSIKYLQLAEEEYVKISKTQTAAIQKELQGDDYNCGGLQKMICPVCNGTGVIIKNGPFDRIYKTCPYSLGESYLTCEEYNQFMRGELDPKTQN